MSLPLSVRTCGAMGDGRADDAPALQQALDAGVGEVWVPSGVYRLERTLRIGSDTTLRLAPDATIRLADGAGPRLGVEGFVLTNRDHVGGDRNITVAGGIWDGNNPGNPRGPDGPRDSYSGVAIDFRNVRGLTLRSMTVRDPESFFMRLGQARDFTVEDITFEAPHARPNQDGIHLGGFCQDGIIRRIQALGAQCTNDDMIALNADDDVERAVNLGMKRGPIRRIQVCDVSAEDAYTFVRLLSQDQPIEDVQIRGIRGACRYYALNLNRWRFPPGKGRIARVLIQDVAVARRPSGFEHAMIHVTLNVQNIEIRNVHRPADDQSAVATLEVDNGAASQVWLDGLSKGQRQALAQGSTAQIDYVKSGDDGVRTSLSPGDRLRLPHGGFECFRLRAS